jgi:UDP-3-O-[3-hydroxymyristoyl] glucosamine N-acyltransferase
LKKEVSATLIRVKDAYASFALILKTYEDYTTAKPKEIIEQPSFISTTAKVGEKVYIGAFAYLGENVVVGENTKIYPNAYLGDNVKIGANTIIYAGVKIYKDCVIGDNAIIHAGTVIGSDGFGFAFENGAFQKIPHV